MTRMDLPRFLALVRARRWLVVGIVVVAAALALAASLVQPSRYRASADLLFGPTTNAASVVAGANVDTSQANPDRTAATNLALASLDAVAAQVHRQFPGESTDKLKHAVTLEAQGQSDVVTVHAEWRTPTGAARVANAFAAQVVALRRRAAQSDIQRAIDALEATLTAPAGGTGPGAPDIGQTRARISQLQALKALQTGDVHVVQRAAPPQHRSAPTPVRNAVIAGGVALVLALFLVVLLARFDERVRDEDELTDLIGAPVLARLPQVPRRRIKQPWPDGDRAFAEAVEFLRLNLQLIGPNGRLVAAVTSPAAGDGKTTVVAWLARSLALSGETVVAVDFDLRDPALHSYLGVPQGSNGGVVDVLLERGRHDDRTQPTSSPKLRLLPAGDTQVPAAPGLIDHERLRRVLAQLRDTADYVLVDTSPVSLVAEASAVAGAADGVILVVDLKRVRRKDLLAAKKQLVNARATILGVVLNRAAADIGVYEPRERAGATANETNAPATLG